MWWSLSLLRSPDNTCIRLYQKSSWILQASVCWFVWLNFPCSRQRQSWKIYSDKNIALMKHVRKTNDGLSTCVWLLNLQGRYVLHHCWKGVSISHSRAPSLNLSPCLTNHHFLLLVKFSSMIRVLVQYGMKNCWTETRKKPCNLRWFPYYQSPIKYMIWKMYRYLITSGLEEWPQKIIPIIRASSAFFFSLRSSADMESQVVRNQPIKLH